MRVVIFSIPNMRRYCEAWMETLRFLLTELMGEAMGIRIHWVLEFNQNGRLHYHCIIMVTPACGGYSARFGQFDYNTGTEEIRHAMERFIDSFCMCTSGGVGFQDKSRVHTCNPCHLKGQPFVEVEIDGVAVQGQHCRMRRGMQETEEHMVWPRHSAILRRHPIVEGGQGIAVTRTLVPGNMEMVAIRIPMSLRLCSTTVAWPRPFKLPMQSASAMGP